MIKSVSELKLQNKITKVCVLTIYFYTPPSTIITVYETNASIESLWLPKAQNFAEKFKGIKWDFLNLAILVKDDQAQEIKLEFIWHGRDYLEVGTKHALSWNQRAENKGRTQDQLNIGLSQHPPGVYL